MNILTTVKEFLSYEVASPINKDIKKSMGVWILTLLVVISPAIFASYATLAVDSSVSCSATYSVCGVLVCETNEITSDKLMNALTASAVMSSFPDTIYLNDKYLFAKEILTAHEYCHIKQFREGRGYDEEECWIAQFSALKC